MTATDVRTDPASPGAALVDELLWVHGHIRHDLAVVQALSAQVLAGATPEDVSEQLGRLQTNSPLWKLRVNCLYYCRFVHAHHHLEDVALFPELRRTNPALGPVVDKLEADHRRVADFLDEIEAAVRELGRADTHDARQRIVEALDGLREHLLAHLAYEEIEITPTLAQWTAWPHQRH
jgi:iron-sulfur cluster repair protein YtfE (RIC family)